MSRRHCQSEEVDWDMAGESCSEVKTALAGGAAQVELRAGAWHGAAALGAALAAPKHSERLAGLARSANP